MPVSKEKQSQSLCRQVSNACSFPVAEPTDNASVSFVKYKGDYYVSTETNFMHRVNPENLETLEKVITCLSLSRKNARGDKRPQNASPWPLHGFKTTHDTNGILPRHFWPLCYITEMWTLYEPSGCLKSLKGGPPLKGQSSRSLMLRRTCLFFFNSPPEKHFLIASRFLKKLLTLLLFFVYLFISLILFLGPFILYFLLFPPYSCFPLTFVLYW